MPILITLIINGNIQSGT